MASRFLRPLATVGSRSLFSAKFTTPVSKLRHVYRVPPCVQTSSAIHTSNINFNQSIINIQDTDDFTDKVLKNATPVIVDFHASWCGPCKILGPRLESLIADNDGKVIMAKVDIDENSELAIDHGVQAVPTVLAVKDGKVVDKFVGVKDNDELESFVKKLIGE